MSIFKLELISATGRSSARLLRLLALTGACLSTVIVPSAGPWPPLMATIDQPDTAVPGRELHVSPDGSPGNDGSAARPLDLATALSKKGPARPGDTIWLHGGTYRGSFVSVLTGTPLAPITVRQFPGERATLDNATSADEALTVQGAWTSYWGFEITNSLPNRVLASPGSDPPGGRGGGLNIQAPHTKFINLVIHDTAQGIGFWTAAENAELYGNIIYYNGWDAPDRGHGHAIYAQNQLGTKRIADNILFQQFSHGIHVYGSEKAYLDNFRIEGNVAFNNGGIATTGFTRNILIGGGRVADNLWLDSNYTYFPSLTRGQNNIGYIAGCNHTIVRRNYFAGGTPLTFVSCADVTMEDNTLYGRIPQTLMDGFPSNTYYTAPPAETPSTMIAVRPNQYESGRANIIVYNWERRPEVSVDVDALAIRKGTRYEVRDAQNYFGPPVVAGTYDGSPLIIPMSGLQPAAPVGDVAHVPVHTGPEFGVFIFQAKPAIPRNPGIEP